LNDKRDFRKPSVVFISLKETEELTLINLVYNLTFSSPGLKAVSSNESPG
jgi:hypothetical protein